MEKSGLACDLLANQLGLEPFSWGGSSDNLTSESEVRATYIAALKAADGGDFSQLMVFVKT